MGEEGREEMEDEEGRENDCCTLCYLFLPPFFSSLSLSLCLSLLLPRVLLEGFAP